MTSAASEPTLVEPHRVPRLEVHGARKRFPGVQALDGVDLRIYPGEVLAVVGENGAGKSTLMKILAGVQTPDEGEVRIDGQVVHLESVHTALEHGIALIHQELNLAGNLDVGANIFLGREPTWGGPLAFVDRAAIRRHSRELLESVALDVPPGRLVATLSVGQQQMVEIAKALSVDARVLIMDEPTSSLSTKESEALFAVIRKLRAGGVSIVYISHRLGEVKELADRVTVLRDGRNAGELGREEIDHDRMVRLMVGRDIQQFYERIPHQPGDVLLRVRDLETPAHPGHPLSFELRAGEVVGVAGLVGAGRTEMLRVLFGVDPPVAGSIEIAGQDVRFRSPQDAIDVGIALVPEDRKAQGLVLEMAVSQNIGLPGVSRYRWAGVLRDQARERADTERMIAQLRIKTPSPRQVVQVLSGGNQQKVVLGKWLALQPRILLLDEPTRGIDVGAKQEIYHLMEELAASGVGVLFVSSEMEEILGMSDRALVFHEGRISGELQRDELSEEAVMFLATGGTEAGVLAGEAGSER